MLPDRVLLRLLAPLLAAAALAAGCAVPMPVPPVPDEPPEVVMPPQVEAPPKPDTTPAPAESVTFTPAANDPPAMAMLAYADQVRALALPAAALELSRLMAAPATVTQQFQTALVLLQTRAPGDSARAAQLLQRVQAENSPEARPLHPLARMLGAQLQEQRRLEELVERQGHQLRDSQRRAEVLQDRLEALRAIERGRPTRPTTP